MKKFLKYLLLIIFLFISLLFLLDSIYTYAYKHGTPRNKVSYLMQSENDTIDYIFIGSSRVDNTINAKIISDITGKSAINLGFQSAKLEDYYLILKLIEERNIKSERIFIQVDYVYNLDGNSELLRSEIMPFLNDPVISEHLKQKDPDYFKLKNIPFYRYLKYDYKIGFREFFNSVIHNNNKINLENGFFPKYGHSGEKLTSSLPKTIAEENSNLTKIDSFAAKHDLSIIYFMAPFCPNTKNLDYSKKLNEKLNFFLDYSNIFPNNENYFYNCSHLNNLGASVFSKLIAQDIIGMEK